MLTEGVTNMPTWVVITAICKFCDTSPLSLWKRRSRLHHTFWKLYVILLSALSHDRYWNIFFHLFEYSHPSINQEDRFYGSCRNSSFGSKSGWKIQTQSVKRLPNSNLISGEVFTRGRRPNDNDALKWLIFVEAPAIVIPTFPSAPFERTINLSLCTIVPRSRYFFCLTIPLRNCYG